MQESVLTSSSLAQRILLIRGQRVMMDADLAELYGVETKVFNQAIKRHATRFPVDFMFELTPDEKQEVVTNCDHLQRLKFSPYLPKVFTEHGTIMAASILNSPKAVEMSVFVVRAFVQLREWLQTHGELASRLELLEAQIAGHENKLSTLIATVRQLTALPNPHKTRPIGFIADTQDSSS